VQLGVDHELRDDDGEIDGVRALGDAARVPVHRDAAGLKGCRDAIGCSAGAPERYAPLGGGRFHVRAQDRGDGVEQPGHRCLTGTRVLRDHAEAGAADAPDQLREHPVVCLAQLGQHDRRVIETELQARGGAPEEAIARVEFQYHVTMMPQGAEAASE